MFAPRFWTCLKTIAGIETNSLAASPNWGVADLYQNTGGEAGREEIMARLWVLNLADGIHSLLDIAERSGMLFSTLLAAANLLCQKGLLTVVPNEGGRVSPLSL